MSLAIIQTDEQLSGAAAKADFDVLIAPLPTKLIRTDALRIDPDYQRGISRRGHGVIQKIITNFDWLLFGVLTVAEQGNGDMVVIDGQHRAIAAHHLGVSHVPALVQSMGKSEQAGTFLTVNSTRTTVGPIDKFNARVTADEEFAKLLSNALNVLEVTLVDRPGYIMKTNETRSIGALQQMAKKFGIGTLQTALEMLIDAQPEVENLLTGYAMHSTVRAVDRVIAKSGDIDRLQRVLENTGFDESYDKASKLRKMLGGQVFLYGAKLLMKDYNKGLHKALPEDFK